MDFSYPKEEVFFFSLYIFLIEEKIKKTFAINGKVEFPGRQEELPIQFRRFHCMFGGALH